MAYHNRKPQCINTLNGFQKLYHDRTNFEVIIIDDYSNTEHKFSDELLKTFQFKIRYIYLTKEEKGNLLNPSRTYNRGFAEATGKIIIIQNPECYHVGDILDYVITHLTPSDYFTFSCYNTYGTDISNFLINCENPLQQILEQSFYKYPPNCTRAYKKSCGPEWYNHPIIHKKDYHFCSAIYKSKLDLLGGFNRSLYYGLCYDDDVLLCEIQHILKLTVLTVPPEKCFVIHQYHEKFLGNQTHDETLRLIGLNNTIFNQMNNYYQSNPLDQPRIIHINTESKPSINDIDKLKNLIKNDQYKFWKIIIHDDHNSLLDLNELKHYTNVTLLSINHSQD